MSSHPISDNLAALERVEEYFGRFRRGVERCAAACSFDPADWQDAYDRLYRLMERYEKKERAALTDRQRESLDKVFLRDVFIRGMMNIRVVGTHVEVFPLVVRTLSRESIELETGSSAMAVFSSATPTLIRADGGTYRMDHLRKLEEAEKLIAKAIERAAATN